MGWSRRIHSSFTRRLLLALPIALLTVILLNEPRRYVSSLTPAAAAASYLLGPPPPTPRPRPEPSKPSPPTPGADFLQSPDLQDYWRLVRDELYRLTPQDISPIQLADTDKASVEDMTAKDPDRAPLDIIMLSPKAKRVLQTSHERMVRLLPLLGPGLPYERRTRGIVMTARGDYFGMVVVSVRMLRRTGSKLPVLVYLDSYADWDALVCEDVFPEMGAECVVLTELFDTVPPPVPLRQYQYKIMAMFLAPFQEVLFMDADAFPSRCPDELFEAEPYAGTGLVLWPDFWSPTASPLLYQIVGIPAPPLTDRKTSEAGILLYDKGRHAEDLLLALYYNIFGPRWYYPLISQGAAGEGDKDTFMLAAQVVGAPWYDVKTPVEVMGRWLNGTWRSVGMKQADPQNDWELSHPHDDHYKKPDELRSMRKPHPKKKPAKKPSSINSKNSTAADADTSSSKKARPFFIHNNIVKLNIESLVDPGSALYDKEEGRYQRMWGPEESTVKDFGYDVERVLWQELVAAGCQLLTMRDCKELRHLAGEVVDT